MGPGLVLEGLCLAFDRGPKNQTDGREAGRIEAIGGLVVIAQASEEEVAGPRWDLGEPAALGDTAVMAPTPEGRQGEPR